jgi:hypothetical protein
MNTTSQESGKQGDGRSQTGQSGQTGATGSQGSQMGSTGSQTGTAASRAGSTGSQTGSIGSSTGGGSMATQTGSHGTQSGMHQSGTQSRGQSWGGSEAEQHSEGTVARTIEQQTAKLPSDLFLWAAVGSIGVSAMFEFMGDKDKSRFVGQWVAPFLLFGVYNKLVKTLGSDRSSQQGSGRSNQWGSSYSSQGQGSSQWSG